MNAKQREKCRKEQQRVLGLILRTVAEQYVAGRDRMGGDSDGLTQFVLNYGLSPFEPQHIESMFSRTKLKTTDFEERRPLLLSPIESSTNIQPMLFLHLDFTEEVPEVRLKLVLRIRAENQDWQLLAIRFETPEGGDERGLGSHNYYHAQFTTDLRNGLALPLSKWLPQSEPAIPLDARSPVTLALCILTALYGGRYLAAAPTTQHLGKHAADMLCGGPAKYCRLLGTPKDVIFDQGRRWCIYPR